METRFQIEGQWKADVAITFAWKGEGPEDACHVLESAAPWVTIAPAWRDFSGEQGQAALLYGPEKMDIARVAVLGLGEQKDASLAELRLAMAKILLLCREKGLENVGLDMYGVNRIAPALGRTPENLARELVLAAHLALYRYDRFKEKKDAEKNIRWLAFLLDDAFCPDQLRAAARLAEAEAAGVCLARDLANAPANVLTPSAFADEAENVAMRYGMGFKVLGPEALENEGMAAYLAVAAGSRQEPRMAVLEYPRMTRNESTAEANSAGAKFDEAPLVLVGKGLCFDSGGISLKPAAGMEAMKGDMSGAAAVLGVFEALGQLAQNGVAPKRRIVGLMPCTENMPGGNATRPGDVVYAKTGKSVEIVNTDAEGRLVLIDALAYGEEKYRPAVMIDIATLTGACAVALGENSAGLFTDDEALAEQLHKAGEQFFERNWRLPLWKDMLDGLQSPVADLQNSGPREGGALRAAIFLRQFVGDDVRWAHLDIAAADNADTPLNPKGGTGFGVRTLLGAALAE